MFMINVLNWFKRKKKNKAIVESILKLNLDELEEFKKMSIFEHEKYKPFKDFIGLKIEIWKLDNKEDSLDPFEYDGDFQYHFKYPGERSRSYISDLKYDDTYPMKPIKWKFVNPNSFNNSFKEIEFFAQVIDSEVWELLELCVVETKQGLDEWASYRSVRNPDLKEIVLPNCNAGPYISSTMKVYKNVIDSTCDVNGTMLGASAERIYVYYIKDTAEYAIIENQYMDL